MYQRPFALMLILQLSIAGAALTDEQRASEVASSTNIEDLISSYCLDCHNSSDAAAGLDFEEVDAQSISAAPAIWEKVVKKLRTRQMPPSDV